MRIVVVPISVLILLELKTALIKVTYFVLVEVGNHNTNKQS